jgi:hypothetical protein
MKAVLNNLPDKSLVLDMSSTATYGKLQACTLQRGDCFLYYQHFKYKSKEVKAEDNVMNYFKGGTFILYVVK